MKVALLHSNAQAPTRGSKFAAGFDLYMPEAGIIEPNQVVKVGLGIATEIPEGFMALLLPRSGVGFKHGLEVNNTVGVIDADYRDEWFAALRVKSGHRFVWGAGERLLQAVLVPRYIGQIEVVDSVEKTDRTGGLGSTGK